MRRWIIALALVCASACNDDEDSPAPVDASTSADASVTSDAAIDGSAPIDASAPDAATPRSLLPRPGTLEHPPTALPDDLKPPR